MGSQRALEITEPLNNNNTSLKGTVQQAYFEATAAIAHHPTARPELPHRSAGPPVAPPTPGGAREPGSSWSTGRGCPAGGLLGLLPRPRSPTLPRHGHTVVQLPRARNSTSPNKTNNARLMSPTHPSQVWCRLKIGPGKPGDEAARVRRRRENYKPTSLSK